MPNPSYSQNSRLGNKQFLISEGQLLVKWKAAGKEHEQNFNLSLFLPELKRVKRHFPMLVYVPAAGAGVAGLIMQVLLNQNLLPREVIIFVGALFIVVALWTALKGIAPVEYVICQNKKGEFLTDIVKGEQQSVVFEEFITELGQHIQMAQSR